MNLNRISRSLVSLTLVCLSVLAVAQSTPLRPGDRIAISSAIDPSYNRVLNLSSNGSIALQGLDSINAAGMTVEKLEETINHRLLTSGRLLQVHVGRAYDPRAPIGFAGAVRCSSELPCRPNKRLSDILAIAEPTEFADLRLVTITDGEDKSFLVNASGTDFKGSDRDLLLRPGDRILVPLMKSPNEVYVLGGVNKPGSVPFVEGLVADTAILQAGGVSGHGDPDHIWIERSGRRLEGLPKLERGDVLHVELVEQRSFVSVQGAVMRPGIVQFHEGMTLGQVIEAAGGPTVKADISRVHVKSLLARSDKQFDLAAIKRGRGKDIKLLASDIVDVPLVKADKKDRG